MTSINHQKISQSKTVIRSLKQAQNETIPRNAKLLVITRKEKSNTTNGNSSADADNSSAKSQKRKMLIVLEDTPEDEHNSKLFKGENEPPSIPRMTFLTDRNDSELSQSFHEIIQEILNYYLKSKQVQPTAANHAENCFETKQLSFPSGSRYELNHHIQNQPEKIKNEENNDFLNDFLNFNNEEKNNQRDEACTAAIRLPVILPPKKNRFNIALNEIESDDANHGNPINRHRKYSNVIVANTSIINNNKNTANNSTVSTVIHKKLPESNTGGNFRRISSTTEKTISSIPKQVIVKPGAFAAVNQYNNKQNNNNLLESITCEKLNASPDFIFLIKLLPDLEKVPDSQKNYVKNSIKNLLLQFSTENQ